MNGSKSDGHLEKNEKEETHLDRILRSNASRRLFPWASGDRTAERPSKELEEQQRLRWNFDFMSETPLPGRYQWVRVDHPAASRDADGPQRMMRNSASERRSSRQNLNSPYIQKSTRRPRPSGDPMPQGAESCKVAIKFKEDKKST